MDGHLVRRSARDGLEEFCCRSVYASFDLTASPFAFNGHLFCLSEDGLTYVIKPGPEFDILATNPLDERCLSSPAIAGDKLLIRTATRLYCLSEGAKPAPGKNEDLSE